MHVSIRGIGRSHLPVIAAALGTLIVVAACSTTGSASGAPASAGSGASAAAGSVNLAGTAWKLSQVVAADGTALTLPDGVAPTADFSKDTVSGNAGCNRYSAAYTVTGSTIKISQPAMTMMACADPIMKVESAFAAALTAVDTVAQTSDSLTLSAGTGSPKLVFSPATAVTLTGTSWAATGINNGKQAVVSPIVGTDITAVFGTDGNVTGNGGCNTYNGGYTTDGAKIKIGPLASTMKLCNTPEGVDTQEQQFLAAMQAATTYAINGDTLELRDDSGAMQAFFVAAPAQ